MNIKSIQRIFALIVILGCFLAISRTSHQVGYSASLTSVSDTINNSRLSFRGALTSGNTVGTTQVLINTTAGSYPSTSAAQLVEGDVVKIGSGGTLNSYTVASVSSNSIFTITSTLASGDTESGDDVISTQSATHTVRFTTANAIANGRFRVLIPAVSNTSAATDGIPDGGAFDFGASAPTITCPNDVSNYDFVSGAATASSSQINNTYYHTYECAYSGTGGIGTTFNSANNQILINNIINPAPKTNHTTGSADTYNIVIQHLDSSLNVIDTTTAAIGVIEAVRVTASVAPQITFNILGVASGTSICGTTTTVTTTPAAVPFGEISISAFTLAAQGLSVSTNAANGFSVTAIANDQLGLDGDSCTGDNTGQNCIRDTACDSGPCTHTSPQDWTSTSNKGFGYSLHDLNSTTTEAFAYNGSGRTFNTKQFPDAEDSQTAETIFSSTTVADNHNVHVCYKIIAATTNAAGNYENYITYTATATF